MTIPPQLDKHRILGQRAIDPATADERRRAVRYTASRATDAADLAQLLDMLGLTAADARTEVSP